jgi:hypothetical protein
VPPSADGLLVRGALLLIALICAPARAEPLPSALASARARELARVLDLEPVIDELVNAAPPATTEEAIARLSATEQAIIVLSRAALAIDSALARLRHEELQAKNAHDAVQSHHEGTLTRWNLAAVLAGNGIAAVGAAMQFGNDTVAKAGDGVTIAGAALAAAFSVVALVKRDTGPLPLTIDTNLLAPFFDRPPTVHSRYADWLWRYLDTPPSVGHSSIRQELVDKWTHEHRVPAKGTPPDEHRLDLLTRPLRAAGRVDAHVLDDRADMLADVREHLGAISVALELLWSEVRTRR